VVPRRPARFDVPVAAATLAVVLIYRRALGDRRWALALGPALGVAISIKHNALFIPVLLALHYGLCLLLARAAPPLASGSRSRSWRWPCSPR
jgi:4-amino-4-deoxy-L-arabinose transferase-like glycosyltransferase